MEALFELLFSNPIFAILLIMGLISLFNRMMGGQNQEESETSGQSTPSHTGERTRPPQRTKTDRDNERTTMQTTSIEEQRERQMAQLAGRMNTEMDAEEQENEKPSDNSMESPSKRIKETDASSHAKDKMKKRMRGKLNKQGLVDSVVMAEVLGQPRSRKPYQNVLTRRK